MRDGHGSCRGHHGELLQGVFPRHSGSLLSDFYNEKSCDHGLVTLPINSQYSHARFIPDSPQEASSGAVERLRGDPGKVKALRAGQMTLDYLASAYGLYLTGELTITSTLQPGCGMGSSTADVVATIRAIVDSAGITLPISEIAHLAVAAEGASDPTMNDDIQTTNLFAQREGKILQRWNCPLPPLMVVGCCCGNPVDTDELYAHDNYYSSMIIQEFARLREDFGCALASSDAAGVGAVATRSAQLNQERLHKPELDVLLEVCADCCAVGVQIAHSGPIAGILFDASAFPPNHSPCPRSSNRTLPAQIRDCRAALESLNLPLTIVEHIGG